MTNSKLYNGRTAAEWQAFVEQEEKAVELQKEKVFAQGLDVGKAAKSKKQDISKLDSESRRLQAEIKMLKNKEEHLETLKGFVIMAERYEKGHAEIIEFLEEVLEEDMDFYHNVKENCSGMTTREMNEEGLSQGAIMLARMTEADARELFQKDLDARYYKMVKQIETKVGEIIEFDLGRNNNLSFDGYVQGTNGSAYITTIIAGGHNIQRKHFRTILKEVK